MLCDSRCPELYQSSPPFGPENLYKICGTEVNAVINQATCDLFQPLLIFKTIDHVFRAYHCRPLTKDLINMYRVHSELLHQEFTNCDPYPQVINLMLSDEPIINVFLSMKFSKSVSRTIWRRVPSEMATYTANYSVSNPEDNIYHNVHL